MCSDSRVRGSATEWYGSTRRSRRVVLFARESGVAKPDFGGVEGGGLLTRLAHAGAFSD